MKLDADIIIVGSGVGGATLARELAKRNKKVLIVEKGHLYPSDQIGSELNAFKYYDKHGIWSKSTEGVFYYRAIMVGGTSIVSCGNGVRTLENELKNLGIDLTEEFLEAEKELGIKPIPSRFIGRGTRRIMEAASKLGFDMEPMPKFINFDKCSSCGNCVLGCRSDAKWTTLPYLNEAQDNGAFLVTETNITKVLISNGKAIGIEVHNRFEKKIEILANIVVLAAGGIGTPIILQNSGIDAGQKLFLDLFNVTIGLTKDTGLAKEVTMAAISENDGFILSPFIDVPFALVSVVPVPLRRNLKFTQRERVLGIMVKIQDDCLGKVHKDGTIKKTITANDLSKLNKGTAIVKEILINAGVESQTIVTTKIRGAHPGGTAAIDEVVDIDLNTKIENLFISDASVLPISPGAPPIVTLVALSKKLAKKIINEL